MKRQRRYTTEAAIIKDIDAARRKMIRIRTQADAEKSSADLFAGDDPQQKVERGKHLDESARLWKKAERIENTRLPKLGRVLVAFQTEPFPVEGLNVRQAVLENNT